MEVKKLRKQLNMSQKAFAEHFRIPLRTLQGWEAGRPTPSYIVYMLELLIYYETQILKERREQSND